MDFFPGRKIGWKIMLRYQSKDWMIHRGKDKGLDKPKVDFQLDIGLSKFDHWYHKLGRKPRDKRLHRDKDNGLDRLLAENKSL